MKTIDTTLARLEDARVYAAARDAVASAEVWDPTAEEIADYASNGIALRPRLLITVWRSERNSCDTKWDIEGRFGLNCVSDGSSTLGPCYDFEVRRA